MKRPELEFTRWELQGALERLRDRVGRVDISLDHNMALCLMVAVQIASKSPHYSSSTCKKVVKWSKAIANMITRDDPALKRLFANGWRPEYGPQWEIEPICKECGASIKPDKSRKRSNHDQRRTIQCGNG